LVEISQGKQLGVNPHTPRVHAPSTKNDTIKKDESMRDIISFSAFSSINTESKKSLNLGVRKRENERIEAENYKFA
jgi:hypothetical protein